ncbi:MAG: nuclear transport factor 2 family protein [Gemmatimonadota bacterium]|nr:MAG: nuclear transport factor 2 family protein [Gemmatimonadota bacterium]
MRLTKLALVLVLAPCLALSSCAEQAGEQEAQVEMAMTVDLEALGESFAAVRAEYKQAWEAGDATALAALYTEDATRFPPDAEVISGSAAIEQEFAESFVATTGREITITQTDMGASGNLAYSAGTYSYSYQVEGEAEPLTAAGNYLVVSKMAEDGSWKMCAHMWTSAAPEE